VTNEHSGSLENCRASAKKIFRPQQQECPDFEHHEVWGSRFIVVSASLGQPPVTELMLDKIRTDGTAAIFHEDGGEGYFFLYNPASREVLMQVQLYQHRTVPSITENDVDILWSLNEDAAGLAVWGRMRAILRTQDKLQEVCKLDTPESPAIEDRDMLATFPSYLDRRVFLEARKRYWKMILLRTNPELTLADEPASLLETHVSVATWDSIGQRAAVFEDEGQTGYLYVYDANTATVLNHLHIYDRRILLEVSKEDIRVLWSADESKCAVQIWGRIRGIIDLKKKREGRVWLENRATPGITDKDWLQGFEVM
jgi:hypothetical protein